MATLAKIPTIPKSSPNIPYDFTKRYSLRQTFSVFAKRYLRVLLPLTEPQCGMNGPPIATLLSIPLSPGLLDNNPEQIRNKLKISAYVLE